MSTATTYRCDGLQCGKLMAARDEHALGPDKPKGWTELRIFSHEALMLHLCERCTARFSDAMERVIEGERR